jgi:hypothetical protein
MAEFSTNQSLRSLRTLLNACRIVRALKSMSGFIPIFSAIAGAFSERQDGLLSAYS